MILFYEPDITKYPKDFLNQATKCPGLEALTGADFAICSLPIPPTRNLQVHIDNRALFVQVKIGYDITSFDNLHSSIARMQKCKIPKGQAILLPIGNFWEDENGLLRIKGKKAFGDTKYSTLGTIYDMWEMRGGTVEALPPEDISDLMSWIERKQKSIQKIEKEGQRDIYPPAPAFQPDDIWQSVEEINDWRSFLVSGIKGFGSKMANSAWEYSKAETSFFKILCMLTDEYNNGKQSHKIPLWGKVNRKKLRAKLGIEDGRNLGDVAFEWGYSQGFDKGWNEFGKKLAELVTGKNKMSVKDAHQKLMKEIPNEIAF